MQQFGDVQLTADGHVTVVEMQRPPHNFFDAALVGALADALEYLDGVDACRAVVLAAQGRSFSAGANFQSESGQALFDESSERRADDLYGHALRLFRTRKPVVAPQPSCLPPSVASSSISAYSTPVCHFNL